MPLLVTHYSRSVYWSPLFFNGAKTSKGGIVGLGRDHWVRDQKKNEMDQKNGAFWLDQKKNEIGSIKKTELIADLTLVKLAFPFRFFF
jgi:hypothetical protein